MNENLYPYIVFLPSTEKTKILRAIFGSKVAVDILRYALNQGVSQKMYQKDLVAKLTCSNKTVIQNLKTLVRLRILEEDMEKTEKGGRTVWIKTYQLSELGKWFALLFAEEKQLSKKEKTEILQGLFRAYIHWVASLAQKLDMDKRDLARIFAEETKESKV